MIDETIRRMSKVQDRIRNIATSAHIHHGKTAFTDNLLAGAGFMSTASAGELDKGMQTWQTRTEKEHLVTVDAANVSMVHRFDGKEFLINLIDTPGHVDFGGNVTRAMRAVDGTVVLVCASEGVMPQTETVLKQALRERVKPVLFINKVDRLIKEMQYSPEQIQKRFVEIVLDFNRLVEQIAEPEWGQKWKVSFQDGSVAFGSARDNWALSLPFMQKRGISFADVFGSYDFEKEARESFVWKNCPLHEVVLDMVIKHLPNPRDAQVYRIPKIWNGDLDSVFGRDLLGCNPDGKLSFVVTRVVEERKSKREIYVGRLYSGTIREGASVYLNNAKKFQKVSAVFMYQGIRPENIGEVCAGNIIAVAGISANAGETVTFEPETSFVELKHIFEPVITKAVSASPQDLSRMIDVLNRISKEDPSLKVEINQETGENLLHGMGEFHLEIVEERILEKGVNVKTSAPVVTYRETVSRKSSEFEGKTPNKHNKLFFVVEPLEPEVQMLIKSGGIADGRIRKKDLVMRDKLVNAGWNSDTAFSVKSVYRGNLFIENTRGIVQLPECIELILDGFEQVVNGGPLAREPCIGLKVVLVDAKLHEDAIHRGPAQIYPAVREGIRLCMMDAGPVLFEPLQTHLIEAPQEYTGELTKLVMNKRGQVLELSQEGALVIVKAKLPVGEMLGWSSDLRSATSGRGVSSLVDQCFEKLPAELQPKIIQQIVKRKGLAAGMLGA